MRVPEFQQLPVHQDIEEGGNKDPCQEDEDFFSSRTDAETIEEVIGKFIDGMEAHGRCIFNF
jgi:hypothetical protein